MKKAIDWQGFNLAEIKSIDSDNMAICDVFEMDGDVVVKSDTNIGFKDWPFELTEDEINSF